MATDYIPKQDTVYQDWLANFITVAGANLGALGLTTADMDPLSKEKGFFDTAITNAETISAQAKAATEKKNLLRKSSEAKARALVKRIQAKSDVSNDLKKQLQITVPGQSAPIPVVPYPPEELVAAVRGSGSYELWWKRGKNGSTILFVIEGLLDGDKSFRPIFTTTKTSYVHSGNVPGQKIIYRVRAQHGEILSDPSNDAIVNG